MAMFKFKWFNASEWKWFSATVMADSRDSAESFLRSKEYVDRRPYSDGEDSLELVHSESIGAPCFAAGPNIEESYF